MKKDSRKVGKTVRVRRLAWTALVVVLLTDLPTYRLSAQAPNGTAPAGYRYGKWAAAAAAIGFGVLGVEAHNRADRSYRTLLDYCRTSQCRVDPSGRYLDPAAEARYQTVVEGDRAARAYFIGAQAALAGAVTLFVLELKYAPKGPPNIPFNGLVLEPGRIGLRVRW